MANNEFDATPRVELNALNAGDRTGNQTGDQTVGKFNFRDVMEHDPLTEALNKNEAAIKLVSASIEDIYKRAAQVHPGGLKGFLQAHEAAHV